MLSLSLAEFPSLSTEERLALGRHLAHTLGPAWAASGELVGSSQMIELVHQSGVAFVVVGRARFERGLRDAERDALITAMLGPQGEDEAELDLEAERRFMARQIPPNAMAPELVEVPAFLISREPLSVARAASLGTSPLQDLGYPEALADASEWGAFTMDLPDGLRMPTEDEWELVAREGGPGSWIVPVPPDGFPGMWPPAEIFALENALGLRAMAVSQVFANGYRRGIGDGRGNWGGSSGNAELHAAARWPEGFGASRLARSL